MRIALDQDLSGNFIVRQQGGAAACLLLGLPLLAFGSLLLYSAISSVVLRLQTEGFEGLAVALIAAFFLLVFAALTLPLGWWLAFGRRAVRIDRASRAVVEVNDWRFWRQEKPTPIERFRAVRVAKEPVDSSPGGPPGKSRTGSSKTTLCQQIRLLAKDPDLHPSLEIGFLAPDARSEAVAIGRKIADSLRLPLEIAPADQVLFSPAREAAEREADAPSDA